LLQASEKEEEKVETLIEPEKQVAKKPRVIKVIGKRDINTDLILNTLKLNWNHTKICIGAYNFSSNDLIQQLTPNTRYYEQTMPDDPPITCPKQKTSEQPVGQG